MRRRVTIAYGAGLALIVLAVILVPTHAPLTAAGSNSAPTPSFFALEQAGAVSSCQPAGTLPRGTSAIRISVEGVYYSPPTTIELLSGTRVIEEARHEAGGPAAPTVTIPVRRLAHAIGGARICMTIGPTIGPVRFHGAPRHSTRATNPLQEATLRTEYLRPGPRSWWSYASSIVHNLGIGRAPGGAWAALLAIVLMLAVVVAVSRLALKELR